MTFFVAGGRLNCNCMQPFSHIMFTTLKISYGTVSMLSNKKF